MHIRQLSRLEHDFFRQRNQTAVPQASHSLAESANRSHFTFTFPARPGMGLNVLRGDSSGTILATGRPSFYILNSSPYGISTVTLKKR